LIRGCFALNFCRGCHVPVQRVRAPARQDRVVRALSLIEPCQQLLELGRMRSLDARLAAALEEGLQPLVSN
jgi:hypothetical protein